MLGATLSAGDYLSRVCQEIQRLDRAEVENVSALIEQAYDDGRFVFIIGNGGSGANASHLCEDLAKCTLRDILKAVDWANANGLTTVGITGFSGGKLKVMAHHDLHVPVDDMGIAESIHLVVFHWIIDDLYRRFSAKSAPALTGAAANGVTAH
jgi:D-sedoheptulose 7-phosphate isomerase